MQLMEAKCLYWNVSKGIGKVCVSSLFLVAKEAYVEDLCELEDNQVEEGMHTSAPPSPKMAFILV